MQIDGLKEKDGRKKGETERKGEIKSRWISLREVETPSIVGDREGRRGGVAHGVLCGSLMG